MLSSRPAPAPLRSPLLVLALALTACESPDTPSTPRASTPGASTSETPVYEGGEEFADDGAGNASFSAFRDTLRAVVARRDTSALLAVVADDAQLSYDEAPGGPDGLRTMWLSGAPRDETLWTVLDRLLSSGSVEEDGAFTVPFVAGLWPEDLDPHGHVATAGEATSALDRPGGTQVAQLSGVHILPLADSTDASSWHVVLPDGSDAFIDRAAAVSPVGYRATFWQTPGEDWQLHVFVSGD